MNPQHSLIAWQAVCGIAACVAAAPASAQQAYPDKPIRIVVGYPPGGSSDFSARILAQRLSTALGQSIVVDNRGGAAGNIGTDIVAKAPADGYTFLFTTVSLSINETLYTKLPFDLKRDFVPVIFLAELPNAMVVPASSPVKTVAEFIALAKAKPGQINFGSGGTGSSVHAMGELFKLMAGVDMVHIPYKGNAQALNDVIGGQVDMILSALPPALPLAKAGKVRILGIAMPERLRSLPEIPTVAEQGLPGYEMSTWYGVFAPAGTPPEVTERIGTELRRGTADPKVRDLILAQGIEPLSDTPAEFRAFVNAELAKWAKVVKAAGIKGD